ncbi:MAG: hypothetical protein K8R21_10290 [Leptospira sp.]|nr:hypothetical protein [Leptospira sp.]
MLEARDLFSGIVVVDTGRLAELHDGFRSNLQSTIIAGPEQLRVTFDDGTEFLLNEKDVIVGNYFKGDIYPGNSVKPPQFLSWQKEGLRGELLFDKLRKAKDLNFLKPVFLVNKNTSTKTAWDGLGPDAHPVSLLYSQNPEGFFVLHPRSISREENEISMIDFSGRILWTIPFPGIKSQLEDSILSSGYLIIVIKKQFISTILGIDLKNGKVEWSQKL